MGHGSYQHSYSGGGGCSGGGGASTSLSLSPSVTKQLSMHRDLSETLQSFQGSIAEAHPSHRIALAGGRGAATAGLDETTEVRCKATGCIAPDHQLEFLACVPCRLCTQREDSVAPKLACARVGMCCSCWANVLYRASMSCKSCGGQSSTRYDASLRHLAR
eukprot:COSAG02_NODE_174_length_31243_cov_76.084543_20_plen_161_part_00